MTSRSKQQSWDAFNAWCDARGLCAAPAHPWTLAAYVRSLENSMRVETIRRHVGMIGQVHFEKLRRRPDRDPLVRKTLDVLNLTAEQKKLPKVPALFRADDFTEDTAPPRRRAAPAPANGPRTLRDTPKLVRRKRV